MPGSIKSDFVYSAIDEMNGMRKRQPTRSELDKYFVGCGGPWKGFDSTVNWCGIFTAYLLRQLGAKIRWKMGYGIENLTGKDNPQGIKSVLAVQGNKGITIGDIAIRDASVHHFIVLSQPDEHGTFNCVEGNYGGVGNPWLHKGKNEKNNISRVRFYYRVF
jgi:hypothetical protein